MNNSTLCSADPVLIRDSNFITVSEMCGARPSGGLVPTESSSTILPQWMISFHRFGLGDISQNGGNQNKSRGTSNVMHQTSHLHRIISITCHDIYELHLHWHCIMNIEYCVTTTFRDYHYATKCGKLPNTLFKVIYTLRLRQNGRHFADDIFKRIFFNENVWISITFSLKFVPKGPISTIQCFG